MKQISNIGFCFKTDQRATEAFQLITQPDGANTGPRTKMFNGVKDFGTSVKITKMTNAVYGQTAAKTHKVIETVSEFIYSSNNM
jgi:hypothetical protein